MTGRSKMLPWHFRFTNWPYLTLSTSELSSSRSRTMTVSMLRLSTGFALSAKKSMMESTRHMYKYRPTELFEWRFFCLLTPPWCICWFLAQLHHLFGCLKPPWRQNSWLSQLWSSSGNLSEMWVEQRNSSIIMVLWHSLHSLSEHLSSC